MYDQIALEYAVMEDIYDLALESLGYPDAASKPKGYVSTLAKSTLMGAGAGIVSVVAPPLGTAAIAGSVTASQMSEQKRSENNFKYYLTTDINKYESEIINTINRVRRNSKPTIGPFSPSEVICDQGNSVAKASHILYMEKGIS